MRTQNMQFERQAEVTRARYNRIAPVYDVMECLTERMAFGAWRRELWSRVTPGHILEVGVGTGKNLDYYPGGTYVTGIDLSDGMLERARRKALNLGLNVDLQQMDVQHLNFPDATFDAAVATFVFCSVPDPVQGLRELGRVVRPEGEIWLMEHVRVNTPIAGRLMDMLNPIVVRLMGANINRQTVENVQRAGLRLVTVENLRGEMVKLFHAQPGSGEDSAMEFADVIQLNPSLEWLPEHDLAER